MKQNNVKKISIWLVCGLLASTFFLAAYRVGYKNSNDANNNATALAEPNMSTTAILVWASEAAMRINTYTYLTYRQDLQQMQNYFSPNAWETYRQVLKIQHYHQSLIQQQMAVSATPYAVPLLIKQGVKDERYTWQVEVPLLLHFQNGARAIDQKMSFTMVIQRTPRYLGKRGIGIIRLDEKKSDV